MTAFSKITVTILWTRANGRCERCGRFLSFEQRGTQWSAHHRAPRSAGGSKNTLWVGAVSNGLILCGSGVTGCHGWVESHRAEAVSLGLIVSRIGVARPADIPVTVHELGSVRLTDDGKYRRENN